MIEKHKNAIYKYRLYNSRLFKLTAKIWSLKCDSYLFSLQLNMTKRGAFFFPGLIWNATDLNEVTRRSLYVCTSLESLRGKRETAATESNLILGVCFWALCYWEVGMNRVNARASPLKERIKGLEKARGQKAKSSTVEHRSLSNLGLNVNQLVIYANTSWARVKFNWRVKNE